jgi:RNA polymerase sigma factor (sigma-70 family)
MSKKDSADSKVSNANPLWQADFELVRQSLSEPLSQRAALFGSRTLREIRHVVVKTDVFRVLSIAEREDVVADVVEKCYADRAKFKGNSRFSTWMCGYARNITLNYCSKLIRRSKKIKFELRYLYQRDFNPVHVILETERAVCLWKGFNLLPIKYRLIVSDYVFERKSLTAIGRDMGLPYAVVKAQYCTAISMLREKYKYLYNHGYYAKPEFFER